MTVDSLEIVVLTCIFVAPGFIIDIIVNLFCPSGDRKESIHLITCIIYSVVQCALLSWLYVMIWVYRETDFIKFIRSQSINIHYSENCSIAFLQIL